MLLECGRFCHVITLYGLFLCLYSFPPISQRRKMQVAVQGKFKKRIRFDNVFSGQEFVKPLRNIPGR